MIGSIAQWVHFLAWAVSWPITLGIIVWWWWLEPDRPV
jgi:hypothetical protein